MNTIIPTAARAAVGSVRVATAGLTEAELSVATSINGFTAFTVATEAGGVRIESRTVGVDGRPTAGADPVFDPTIVAKMPAGTQLYTDGATFAGSGIVDLVAGLLGAFLIMDSSTGGSGLEPKDTTPTPVADVSSEVFGLLGMLLGIDLQADFLDHLGGEYGFGLWGLSLEDPSTIGAAFVAATDNPRVVGTTAGALTGFLAIGAQGAIRVTPKSIGGGLFSHIDLAGSGLPVTIDMGVADDHFVVGIGEGAAETVVEGSGASLADDPRYLAAMVGMPEARNGLLYIDIAALLPLIGTASEGEITVTGIETLAIVGWIDGDMPAVTAFLSIP